MNIKLLDYNPHGTFDGDTFEFEVDGEIILVERWSNDSSSGIDFYNKSTGKFVSETGPREEAIEQMISRVDEIWAEAFITHLEPIYVRERTKLLEKVNSA